MLRDPFDAIRQDAENWARLQGVMRMLALPPVRDHNGKEYRRKVEVEILEDTWQIVDGVSFECDRVTFFTNDPPQSWPFSPSEGVPRWRVDHSRIRVMNAYGES